MLRSKTARVAAFGFLAFWVSIAGAVIHDLIVSHLVWKPHITPDVYILAILAVTGMLLSLTATIVSIVGWTRRRVVLKSGAAGAAAFGLLAFWAGLAWGEMHYYIAKRHDPLGWFVDHAPYSPPLILAVTGLIMLLTAIIVSIAGRTYRRCA